MNATEYGMLKLKLEQRRGKDNDEQREDHRGAEEQG